jgi:hypothetical protein
MQAAACAAPQAHCTAETHRHTCGIAVGRQNAARSSSRAQQSHLREPRRLESSGRGRSSSSGFWRIESQPGGDAAVGGARGPRLPPDGRSIAAVQLAPAGPAGAISRPAGCVLDSAPLSPAGRQRPERAGGWALDLRQVRRHAWQLRASWPGCAQAATHLPASWSPPEESPGSRRLAEPPPMPAGLQASGNACLTTPPHPPRCRHHASSSSSNSSSYAHLPRQMVGRACAGPHTLLSPAATVQDPAGPAGPWPWSCRAPRSPGCPRHPALPSPPPLPAGGGHGAVPPGGAVPAAGAIVELAAVVPRLWGQAARAGAHLAVQRRLPELGRKRRCAARHRAWAVQRGGVVDRQAARARVYSPERGVWGGYGAGARLAAGRWRRRQRRVLGAGQGLRRVTARAAPRPRVQIRG